MPTTNQDFRPLLPCDSCGEIFIVEEADQSLCPKCETEEMEWPSEIEA